jgi:hypothetical protein
MTSLSGDVISNSTFIEIIFQYLGRVCSFLQQGLGLGPVVVPLPDTPQALPDYQSSDIFSDFVDWFAFDDFQFKLLKGFLVVLTFNIILICTAWHFYGRNISDKFMRPGLYIS